MTESPVLYDRDADLAALHAFLQQAIGGSGNVVVVSGEAGIGKTSLLEHFARTIETDIQFSWGSCDALFTPRPLGPVYDIAREIPGALRELVESGANRSAIFSAFLDMLAAQRVLVFEDVHWADEATLDLLTFVSRRIVRTECLLIITHRDDEIGPTHPLVSVLGDIPSQHVSRLKLAPLSKASVGRMALGRHRSVEDLYRITGGNPFFVTEALATESNEVPVSVRDAVAARLRRLGDRAREIVVTASVIPTRLERELLEALVQVDSGALDEALLSGMLRTVGSHLAFRHELARRAVEETVATSRRRALHTAVLRALLTQSDADLARLVYHADLAGDHAAVLDLAPKAAEQSASLGAHREAVSHYETAIRHAAEQPYESRARLLEALSYECYLTEQADRALSARKEALHLWREVGNAERIGDCLRWMSRLTWVVGRGNEAAAYAEEALSILEELPPGHALAMARSNRAQLHMLSSETEGAVSQGNRAIALGRTLGDDEVVIHALNNVGTALLCALDDSGYSLLEESLQLALDHGYDEHAARAYANLATLAVTHRRYESAIDYLGRGIRFCSDADLDTLRFYMIAWRARCHLEQCRWESALDDANFVLRQPRLAAITRIPALDVRGALAVRRGADDADKWLDEALTLARLAAEVQRWGPVASSRAERAFLEDDLETVRKEVETVHRLSDKCGDLRYLAELGHWMWRAGAPVSLPDDFEDPYVLQIQGRAIQAAEHWDRLGCPYHAALARSDAPDPEVRLAALDSLESLDAVRAADWLRRRLKGQGVRGVPRGPRPATSRNPAGLTPRQMDVLLLLIEGRTDAEIADELFVSSKTVGHHVSAILGKLGVSSRTEAAAFALRRGLASSRQVSRPE